MAEDLVGMSFLHLDEEGAYKGAVLARVGAEHYLMETVPWSGEGISEITVVSVKALASRGCLEGFMFFRSAELRDAWYRELSECDCGAGEEREPGRQLQ
jgi:hypothetical protein